LLVSVGFIAKVKHMEQKKWPIEKSDDFMRGMTTYSVTVFFGKF